MKKLITLLSLLLLVLWTIDLQAQQPCASDIIHQKMLETDPTYQARSVAQEAALQRALRLGIDKNRSATSNDTIPVVVHVLHSGQSVGTGYNISDAQIQSSIDQVNAAFADYDGSGTDTYIRFALAKRDPDNCTTSTGINRIDATGVNDYENIGISTGTDRIDLFNLSRWNTQEYLNFWVVSEIDDNDGDGGTQGYATFSNTSHQYDGVVCMYNTTGYDPTGSLGYELKSTSNQNETVIHEFGHYLELYHTFQGDGSGCPADTDCTTDGDLCCDTDAHERTYSNVCWTGVNNSCTGSNYGEVVQNYMAYSSQDCKDRFTSDQVARMQASLLSGRAGLLTSPGLKEVTITEPTSACAAATSSTGTDANYGIGITKITVGTWTTESGNAYEDGGYLDNWCNHMELEPNTTYSYAVTTSGNYDEYLRAWIDYDNDGTFSNASELVISPSTFGSSFSGSFTTPSSVTSNTPLRFRFRSSAVTNSTDACYGPTYAQAEDYSVYFASSAALSTSISSIDDLHNLKDINTIAQSFTLSGVDLSANASLSLGSSDFEISTDGNSYSNSLSVSPSGGSISGQNIYVRLKSSLATGDYNDVLTISSSPADDVTISLAGTVAEIEEERGNAFEITSGSTSNYALADNYVGVTGGNSRTYEAWVKTTATTSTSAGIMANGVNSSLQKWIIRMDGGQLRLEINGGYIRGTNYINDNTWHHIAVVLDASTGANLNNVTLYVDGAIETISASSGTTSTINTAASQNLWIGIDHSDRYWEGDIDEVRVWSVVRTQAEIQNNMHLLLDGTETGLEANYQFNETSGTAVIDKIHGYDLTLQGSAAFNSSTVDVAAGSFETTTVGATGAAGVEIEENNLQIDFEESSTAPDGELVIFRLDGCPVNSPGDAYEGTEHWVVRNYGNNQTGLDVVSIKMTLPLSDPILDYHINTMKLYKRASGSDGSWTTMATAATSVDYANGIICFDNLTGFTSFSQLMVGSTGAALPVSMTSFTATRKNTQEVSIDWATSFEEDCFGYSLEKSWDGKNFEPVQFLECQNEGNKDITYSHTDQESQAVYYRLRQLDLDLSYTFSDVRFVEGLQSQSMLRVYPNPSEGQVFFATREIAVDEQVALQLIDVQGRVMIAANGTIAELTEQVNAQLGNFNKGIYFLHATVKGQSFNTRLLLK